MAKVEGSGTAGTPAGGVLTVQGVASGTATVVAGDVASGATDSGNPVKVGSVYNSTPATATTGQRIDLALTRNGFIIPAAGAISEGTLSVIAMARSDTANSSGILAVVPMLADNAGAYNYARNNIEATLLASAARTATAASADITNYNARGGHLVLNVTAIGSTSSIVPTVQGKDALSAAYYPILPGPTIAATGTYPLRVYPAITSTTNLYANDVLPRTWRVNVVHANVDTITYSIGYSLIL